MCMFHFCDLVKYILVFCFSGVYKKSEMENRRNAISVSDVTQV